MSLSPVQISNLALDELPAQNIVTWLEDSLEAQFAQRHYPVAVDEVLASYDWPVARNRQALAVITNDREGEYGYAYQLPNTVGLILRLLPSLADGASASPALLVGQTQAMPVIDHDMASLPYTLFGSTLYADWPDAQLEFVARDAAVASAGAPLIRAIYMALAVKLCMPLLKDATRKRELRGDAEVALQRAQAAAFNSQTHRYGNTMPDATLARFGLTDPGRH